MNQMNQSSKLKEKLKEKKRKEKKKEKQRNSQQKVALLKEEEKLMWIRVYIVSISIII